MLGLFKAKKQKQLLSTVANGEIPRHIAIIMDGNGRWARKRSLPRVAGHRAGVESIRRCLRGARELKDLRYLTFYAFSTENWQRPASEISYLMDLPGYFINREMETLMENNIRLGIVGDVSRLPDHTRKVIAQGMNQTAANDGLYLNFALNYGGRDDILAAARKLWQELREGTLQEDAVDKELFGRYLFTGDMPDPDLLIRTSGELRISNFLLWQIAYSELYFTDILWPDFQELHLYQAIADYQQRNRRYGGLQQEE